MKMSLIFLYVALFSLTPAFAQRYVDTLPTGTKLTTQKDLLIPANKALIFVNGEDSPLDCFLSIKSNPHDRIIKAGSTFVVNDVNATHYPDDIAVVVEIIMLTKAGKKASLMCNELNLYMLDDLFDSIAGAFSVELPDPDKY